MRSFPNKVIIESATNTVSSWDRNMYSLTKPRAGRMISLVIQAFAVTCVIGYFLPLLFEKLQLVMLSTVASYISSKVDRGAISIR